MEKQKKVKLGDSPWNLMQPDLNRFRLARRGKKEAVSLLPRNQSEMAQYMRERSNGKITRKFQEPQVVNVEANLRRNTYKAGATVMKVRILPDYLRDELESDD